MLFHPQKSVRSDNGLDRLVDRIRRAPALTADLFSRVVADGCVRLPKLNKSGLAARIGQLVLAEAWGDAALALIEIELPAWKLRRAVYEDGEWHCNLSTQPNLPIDLDDSAEACHEVLPLAILAAFVEARRQELTTHKAQPQARPISESTPTIAQPVCCDNFA